MVNAVLDQDGHVDGGEGVYGMGFSFDSGVRSQHRPCSRHRVKRHVIK